MNLGTRCLAVPLANMNYSNLTGLLKKRFNDMCLNRKHAGNSVFMWRCDETGSNLQWSYDAKSGRIKSESGCLSVVGEEVATLTCSEGELASEEQAWAITSDGFITGAHGKCLRSVMLGSST